MLLDMCPTRVRNKQLFVPTSRVTEHLKEVIFHIFTFSGDVFSLQVPQKTKTFVLVSTIFMVRWQYYCCHNIKPVHTAL